MTTSKLSEMLKKLFKRRYRAPELNEYALKLGLKQNSQSGNVYYLWSENDIEELLKIIE